MFNNSELNLAVFFDNTNSDLKTLSKNIFIKNLYGIDKNSNPFAFIKKVINDENKKDNVINEIHLIAHGNKEALFFGNKKVDFKELGKAKTDLENLNLKRIVLWICEIGINKKFIKEFEKITGAEIFFSEKEINKSNYKVFNHKRNFINFTEILNLSFLLNWEGNLSWSQVGTNLDGENSGDQTGKSISLSKNGSIIAIGSPQNDSNGNNSGSVRVYKNVDNSWEQIGSDIYGETSSEQSGSSISISDDGSIIAIGAERKNTDKIGNKTGVVRVYKNNDNIWEKIGSDITGEVNYDYSGGAISLSSDGSIVAIGAKKNDGNGSYAGHVRIFKYNNDSWEQIGSDIDGDAAYDYLGY